MSLRSQEAQCEGCNPSTARRFAHVGLPDVREWSVDQVGVWLRKLQLGAVVSCFAAAHVTSDWLRGRGPMDAECFVARAPGPARPPFYYHKGIPSSLLLSQGNTLVPF